MTSSNKARRYLQHHKHHFPESHSSAAELLIIDPTLAVTSMRKFRGRIQQHPSIPQICVDTDDEDTKKVHDDEYGHVAILDEFDEVLENELKRSSVLRTSSLKHPECNEQMGTPTNQQRSFSFALGSGKHLDGKKHDEEEEEDIDEEPVNISSAKSTKPSSTIKSSLSKETFSRLLHSLAFRSGNHTTSKMTMTSTSEAPNQRSCLACQHQPNLDFLPKYKKRPSIFGVLVSKLNTTNTGNDSTVNHCPVCKRCLSKSVFYDPITPTPADEGNQQQNFSSSSFRSSKLLHEHGQISLRTKRRRSLPSLLHSLFDFDYHEKRRLENRQTDHRPSFSSIFTHTLLDSFTREQQSSNTIVRQTSPVSYSSISLAGSDDSEENNIDKSFQQTEKLQVRINSDGIDAEQDEYDHDIIPSKEIELNEMNRNDSTLENSTNQLFLHPPEEKTRSLLVNVFRTRRANVALGSNETNMAGKQFSVSVINLATAISSNRMQANPSVRNDLNLKHALSEENLPTSDGTYIYFVNVNGQHFKERLRYSNASENDTLREILLKLFDKHHLHIETCHICLRSTPTLPLSLDQPVKHLLLDDLIVTGR